ncbi:MAG: helix-turn-helix domain-containing protein [Rhizomicrobium sp.]
MRPRKLTAPLHTIEEVAALLRVSKKTVSRRIASGELAAVRDGHIVRIHRDAIDAFVAKKWTKKP